MRSVCCAALHEPLAAHGEVAVKTEAPARCMIQKIANHPSSKNTRKGMAFLRRKKSISAMGMRNTQEKELRKMR